MRVPGGLLLFLVGVSLSAAADEAGEAKKRWAESPHGPMLERLLPPTFTARQLPQRSSDGAKLAQRYCVQCHNLPNPAMHEAARWPSVIERMVLRMQGRGNMGTLMADMMAGVEAPGDDEASVLLAYFRRNAQRAIDRGRYPELDAAEGEAFRLACNQCHVLPDPQRHTASEWPAVVARMQQNMEWMNRVVGTQPVQGEPQLRIDEINAFLRKHARR
jgi:cytochrome c2